MLRASNYNIYVDFPDDSEEMLLVHGYTGAYDKVSRRVATYVRALETVRPPKPLFGAWAPEDGDIVSPSDQAIAVLKQRGYLTEMGREEEHLFFQKLANKLHTYQQQRGIGYIFMLTYDCNLRCSYCFQDCVRKDTSRVQLLRTMSRTLVDRIFMAMPQIENHHHLPAHARSPRSIGFFGGEPFLERNRRIVEYIITKAQEHGGARFSGVTNGTDLHVYRDLLSPDIIGQLQITLDGPPDEHDQRRIYADGAGSFERIAQNITMALELGVNISVRMNIDRNNVHLLPVLADEIVQRDWHHARNFSAYVSPIHASNEHTDVKTTFGSWELDQTLNQLREQYENMYIIGRPDDKVKHQAQTLFNHHSDPFLKPHFCGAHSGMYVLDVLGDIYACWERTGDPNLRIGNITKDGDFAINEPMNELWRSRNVTTNPVCSQCRFALYCGGGCAAMAETHRGKFFTNFCDGFAARFRASVAEAYLEHTRGTNVRTSISEGCTQ
ncbi:MAG: radical SAM protein [Chloroflexota bacterium]